MSISFPRTFLFVFTEPARVQGADGKITEYLVGDVVFDMIRSAVPGARELEGDELISYTNGDDVRFKQYACHMVPEWATDLRLEEV